MSKNIWLWSCCDFFKFCWYIIVSSYSIGSEDDRGYLHAEAIEEELDIRVIRHKQKKPDGLLEAISSWDSIESSEVMMVGDRYLTDIYGGNQIGMFTVCVDIFTEVNDNKGAIFVIFIWNSIISREDELNACSLSFVLVLI